MRKKSGKMVKNGKMRKKRGNSLRPIATPTPLRTSQKILGKERKNAQKKARKIGKSKEIEKSKDWRVRVQRKNIFEFIIHSIADTGTDENHCGINFRSGRRHSCSLQVRRGRITDKINSGHNFHLITDTGTED